MVLATGHLTDARGRAAVRFPESAVPDVTRRVDAALAAWRVGPGDLLVSGGARGADLVAAGLAPAGR